MQRFTNVETRIFSEKMLGILRGWLPPFPNQELVSSKHALIGSESMKEGSISLTLYKRLMDSFTKKYHDNPDRETLLSSISNNFHNEVEIAWQAFLAEIGEDE